MREFSKIKDVFWAVMGALVFISFLQFAFKTPPTVAEAEFAESQTAAAILLPSTYWVKVSIKISETPEAVEKTVGESLNGLCAESFGTAFTVSEKGYFITNNHVVDQKNHEAGCIQKIAEEKKVPKESLSGLKFEFIYYLSDHGKNLFRVNIAKTWPEEDVALLVVDREYIQKMEKKMGDKYHAPEFIPIPFRTASPSIESDKVVFGKGLIIKPSEPIAIMGNPLRISFVLLRGYLGNGLIVEEGVPYIHFIAPIAHGNSGGPIISLLDMKFIGMVTLIRPDQNGNVTEMSGAVPFWVIQEKMKEAGITPSVR